MYYHRHRWTTTAEFNEDVAALLEQRVPSGGDALDRYIAALHSKNEEMEQLSDAIDEYNDALDSFETTAMEE